MAQAMFVYCGGGGGTGKSSRTTTAVGVSCGESFGCLGALGVISDWCLGVCGIHIHTYSAIPHMNSLS